MNNLKSNQFCLLSLFKQNNCEHFEPHKPIYRSPYNHQELRYVFCTRGSRDTIFRELRENGRVWSFRTALRTHKLDHCGHFEPHIEVYTAIRSRDINL